MTSDSRINVAVVLTAPCRASRYVTVVHAFIPCVHDNVSSSVVLFYTMSCRHQSEKGRR
jgi:hypothetical protein